MQRTTYRLAAIAAVGTIALAGCAGQDSGDRAPSQDSTQSEQAGGGETSSESAQGDSDSSEERASSSEGDSSDSTDSGSSAKDPAGTHIARTAALTITVDDVERASAKVRSTASGAGGYVSSEDTRIAAEDDEDTDAGSGSGSASVGAADATPPTSSRAGSWAEIVVTVPVDELDSTMTKLAEIGTVTERSSDAEDLTKQYTDTQARVRTMKKSIERLRTLIDDTDDLDQIVTLEDELSEREANLESMVSQQKSLEKRTTTAPITVSLVTPAGEEAAEEDEEQESGFVAGLDKGWSGFTSALTVGLTVLGAVTPFAVAGLAVVLPVLWLLRRRTRPTPEAPSGS
ncbi:MAG TPA: DUF4349 domain-containing protein [Candidatus Janibacter merdipullorum]|nr:DUF4349 domain-containing protein [Candidatus Janibacter merdipullorum]